MILGAVSFFVILAHGTLLSILIGIFMLVSVPRAYLLRKRIGQDCEFDERLEKFWADHGSPRFFLSAYLMGPRLISVAAKPQLVTPSFSDSSHEKYRAALLANLRVTSIIAALFPFGVTAMYVLLNSAVHRPYHWDSISISFVAAGYMGISNYYKTKQELSRMVLFDKWVSKGCPTSFGPL